MLAMIRDETEAEGVIMWANLAQPNSQDIAQADWARHWQRMQLRTLIPEPAKLIGSL
ncbi:MAG: hypothetical protein ACR2GY_03330 [Phycisphaerales bacterium]